MKRILVAGGDGHLGSRTVDGLLRRSQAVRILSRKPAPEAGQSRLEWASADLITGKGAAAALEGVEVVVNCATSPRTRTYKTDIALARSPAEQAFDPATSCGMTA